MKSFLQVVAVSLTSAVLGGVIVVTLQAKAGELEASPTATPASSPAPSVVQAHVAPPSRDFELAQRLAALEGQIAAKSSPRVEAAVDEPPIDAADAEAEAVLHRETRAADFAAEPVDPTWARATSQSFGADLAAFEGSTFRVASVECRTAVCRAELTWDSYAAARAQSQTVAEASYTANCMREILTPEPDGDPKAPYTATLYLDCAKQRVRR